MTFNVLGPSPAGLEPCDEARVLIERAQKGPSTAGLSREAARILNRKTVLERIIMQGPISRVELASRLGLSRSAVVEITGELLEHDLLRESGLGASAGGRP